MKKIVYIGGGILACLIVGFIGLGIYLICLEDLYHRTQSKLPEIKEKLINLNDVTLTQITPPEGAIETEREVIGKNLDFYYGVETKVGYKVKNPELLDIQAYYGSMIKRMGWTLLDFNNKSESIGRSLYYYSETCLEVVTFKRNIDEYLVYVYHDFTKQDFSPKLPPMWYTEIRQLRYDAETATCPPKLYFPIGMLMKYTVMGSDH